MEFCLSRILKALARSTLPSPSKTIAVVIAIRSSSSEKPAASSFFSKESFMSSLSVWLIRCRMAHLFLTVGSQADAGAQRAERDSAEAPAGRRDCDIDCLQGWQAVNQIGV